MKNFLKVTVVLTLIAFLPAFHTFANASNQLPAKEKQPEVFAFFAVGQTNPGQLTAAWLSNCGPFTVYVFDITNGVPVLVVGPVVVVGNTFTLGGLTVGHTYWVSVTDCDSIAAGGVKIKF